MAFSASPDADTSLDFRELVVKLRVTTAEPFLACLQGLTVWGCEMKRIVAFGHSHSRMKAHLRKDAPGG